LRIVPASEFVSNITCQQLNGHVTFCVDRLMEEIIGFLLEIFAELFLEILVSSVSRALGILLDNDEPVSPFFAALGFSFFGVIAGAISVLLFPHPFIPPAKLYGISLIVSPTVTGAVMALVVALVRRYGRKSTQIESFANGFAFAFGMLLIRLLFAH